MRLICPHGTGKRGSSGERHNPPLFPPWATGGLRDAENENPSGRLRSPAERSFKPDSKGDSKWALYR